MNPPDSPAFAYAGRTFTIDRATWFRGEGARVSKLLRSSDGRMCCLGSVALQCGLTADQIRDKGGPMASGWKELMQGDRDRSLREIATLMEINDDTSITDTVREARLIEEAASLGMTFVFVN